MTIAAYRRRKVPPLKKGSFEPETDRPPPRDRGYDARWEGVRDAYAKSIGGRCEECMRRGYLKKMDVVDHVVPVRDAPERRLDRDNLDGLCHSHHNGWKRRLESYARKVGALDMLPMWVKNPETRPVAFQITRFGPMKEIFDAERSEAVGSGS